jgi:hypothetical protein
MSNKIKFLAYYLPQYHPIPENDAWWGKGFTEWTNVTKAKPMFKGHYQPRFPSDLGYYDLRVPEVRQQQAEIAENYGIDGFCYYHYWFGNGKMVLERPLKEVISSKQPDFPFCICWANETWKGIWFGSKNKETLIEQEYPGKQDYIDHFNYLLDAFKDQRYIRIDGKCLFSVYIPTDIPDLPLFVTTFRECAKEAGIGDLYLLATRCPENWDPKANGFDGVVGSQFTSLRYVTGRNYEKLTLTKRIINRIRRIFINVEQFNLNFEERQKPLVVDYEEACKYLLPSKKYSFDYFPCVVHDWDNTARAGQKSVIFHNSTPELWQKHLEEACYYVGDHKEDQKIIFIKSWNEWAEGNYLEPDVKWGYQYIEVVKKVKDKFKNINK